MIRAGEVETAGRSPAEAEAVARRLGDRLPAELAPLFDGAFIYSAWLYEEFIHRLAVAIFREAGLEAAAREAGRPDELAARAGLAPRVATVPLDWILRQLTTRQLVEVEGEPASRYRLSRPLPALDPGPIREAQQRHDPSWLPSFVLAETVARDYPAFLRGERPGEDILFSPARFRLWLDYFSNDNRLYAVNNRVGALAVDEWLGPRRRTILELGGGLGSAAAALLERLAGDGRLGAVETYWFTELVPAFLRRGQRVLETRFPGASFLKFGALDMNRPFAEQGVPPGSLSGVYAVNTLHVAHDLAFTLGEVSRALEGGGRLVISECVRPRPGHPVYVEFIFNLMEAFRSPRLHPDYRPNGGFLTPEQWKQAMETAGFEDVRFLPDLSRVREEFPTFYVGAIGARRPG
jgi:SAM-dependent methyltransferase